MAGHIGTGIRRGHIGIHVGTETSAHHSLRSSATAIGIPNDFVPVADLRLLYTDQAEYYAVCPDCYAVYSHMQWSGSTRAQNWREDSQKYLKYHQKEKGWCEFCDPIFGNGGWTLRDEF